MRCRWACVRKAFTGAVPVGDVGLAQFPAEQQDLAFDFAGKSSNPMSMSFTLDSGGVDFGEGVFDAANGLLAVGFALARWTTLSNMPPLRKTRWAVS